MFSYCFITMDYLLLGLIWCIIEFAMVSDYIFDNLHNIYNMCFSRLFVKLIGWHGELLFYSAQRAAIIHARCDRGAKLQKLSLALTRRWLTICLSAHSLGWSASAPRRIRSNPLHETMSLQICCRHWLGKCSENAWHIMLCLGAWRPRSDL